jgi:hypothetical protein
MRDMSVHLRCMKGGISKRTRRVQRGVRSMEKSILVHMNGREFLRKASPLDGALAGISTTLPLYST